LDGRPPQPQALCLRSSGGRTRQNAETDKYRQKNFLFELERGREARDYRGNLQPSRPAGVSDFSLDAEPVKWEK
jgi:hypothetical protein